MGSRNKQSNVQCSSHCNCWTQNLLRAPLNNMYCFALIAIVMWNDLANRKFKDRNPAKNSMPSLVSVGDILVPWDQEKKRKKLFRSSFAIRNVLLLLHTLYICDVQVGTDLPSYLLLKKKKKKQKLVMYHTWYVSAMIISCVEFLRTLPVGRKWVCVYQRKKS